MRNPVPRPRCGQLASARSRSSADLRAARPLGIPAMFPGVSGFSACRSSSGRAGAPQIACQAVIECGCWLPRGGDLTASGRYALPVPGGSRNRAGAAGGKRYPWVSSDAVASDDAAAPSRAGIVRDRRVRRAAVQGPSSLRSASYRGEQDASHR